MHIGKSPDLPSSFQVGKCWFETWNIWNAGKLMTMISERSLLFKELAIFCFNRKEKVDASLGHTGPESGEVEVPGPLEWESARNEAIIRRKKWCHSYGHTRNGASFLQLLIFRVCCCVSRNLDTFVNHLWSISLKCPAVLCGPSPFPNLPFRKLTWQWKIHHLKMYFLLKIVFFFNVMFVFRGVYRNLPFSVGFGNFVHVFWCLQNESTHAHIDMLWNIHTLHDLVMQVHLCLMTDKQRHKNRNRENHIDIIKKYTSFKLYIVICLFLCTLLVNIHMFFTAGCVVEVTVLDGRRCKLCPGQRVSDGA